MSIIASVCLFCVCNIKSHRKLSLIDLDTEEFIGQNIGEITVFLFFTSVIVLLVSHNEPQHRFLIKKNGTTGVLFLTKRS